MLLRTFGGLTLEPGAGERPVPSLGPRRLALLAIVAAAEPRGITRDKILGILWPDSDEDQARHTLSQTLYRLRRETGASWITGTAQLRLGPAVGSDIVEFQQALDTHRLEHAAALYTGPFLDGFYLTGAPEFERWAEENRTRVKRAAIKALESLARRADETGAHSDAVGWWRRLGELEPFEAAYAAGCIRALTAAGDRIGALAVAREHASRVRRELEAEPDPVVVTLAAGLRSAPDRPATTPAAVGPPDAPSAPEPAQAGAAPSGSATPSAALRPARALRRWWVPAAITAAVVTGVLAAWRISRTDPPPAVDLPFLAIGSIQSTDTTTFGPVLRDMLATGLARVPGIDVVSNSRLLELLPNAAEGSTAAAADAARRAGATQIIEGEVGVASGLLLLTLRRVDLRSGRVLQGYSARAGDPFALADSATAAVAEDLGLDPPPGVVASVRTRSAVAYALYEQGLRAYHHSDMVAARQLMEAALERDSTFAIAAAYAWRSNLALQRFEDASRLLPVVRRLATRAVERERLLIDGLVARYSGAPLPDYLRSARTLTDRFPDDPDGHILLGHARFTSGDWAGAVDAYGRAVALDSAAGVTAAAHCRVCQALSGIADAYLWWDSLAAAERTGRRLIALRPEDGAGWGTMTESLLRQGRRANAEAALARSARLHPGGVSHFSFHLDRDLIRSGRSDELAVRAVAELRTATPEERGELPWLLALALRNQGRFREAHDLAADGTLPGSAGRMSGHRDPTTLAIVALEDGRPRESARRFLDMVATDRAAGQGAGFTARSVAWHMALAGTALAAAGDTAQVRALADSVLRIGAGSSFGRDLRLHHFLRGLLLQRQNRHAEAVEQFRGALFSLTDGYTRINLEMSRSLLALDRPREAVAILQPALRGGVDGANTYVTHTELHEALARAFDAAGQPDSAAAHYAAVERAWRNADARFADRYRLARNRNRVRNAPRDSG